MAAAASPSALECYIHHLNAGEEVDRPSRAVTVLSFELQRNSASHQDLDFRISCSKGTYIRALAHDLVRLRPKRFDRYTHHLRFLRVLSQA